MNNIPGWVINAFGAVVCFFLPVVFGQDPWTFFTGILVGLNVGAGLMAFFHEQYVKAVKEYEASVNKILGL